MIVLWSQDRMMGMIVVGCRQLREFSAAEMNLLAAAGNQIATSIDKSLAAGTNARGLRNLAADAGAVAAEREDGRGGPVDRRRGARTE